MSEAIIGYNTLFRAEWNIINDKYLQFNLFLQVFTVGYLLSTYFHLFMFKRQQHLVLSERTNCSCKFAYIIVMYEHLIVILILDNVLLYLTHLINTLVQCHFQILKLYLSVIFREGRKCLNRANFYDSWHHKICSFTAFNTQPDDVSFPYNLVLDVDTSGSCVSARKPDKVMCNVHNFVCSKMHSVSFPSFIWYR